MSFGMLWIISVGGFSTCARYQILLSMTWFINLFCPMSDSFKYPHFRMSSRIFFYLFPVFFFASEFHLNSRGFLGLPLLDPSHSPMHFVLLYFMSVAFSKCIRSISRCAGKLLLPMYYIVVSSAKAEVFSSFSPITIPLMPLFCLMFSENISANIMYRIIDNGHPCRSSLFTRKTCDKCLFTFICVSMF